MWLLILGALILAIPYVLKSYFRHAAERLRNAHAAWEATEKYGRLVLEDRHLNPEVGDFVEFTLNKAGQGMMSRSLLRGLVLPWTLSKDDGDANRLLESMNREQEQNVSRFMVAAMFYDSFRAALSGTALRRIIYWMAATATDKSVPVSRAQVQPMVSAADRLCHSHT